MERWWSVLDFFSLRQDFSRRDPLVNPTSRMHIWCQSRSEHCKPGKLSGNRKRLVFSLFARPLPKWAVYFSKVQRDRFAWATYLGRLVYNTLQSGDEIPNQPARYDLCVFFLLEMITVVSDLAGLRPDISA
jgi:hypothetical protein